MKKVIFIFVLSVFCFSAMSQQWLVNARADGHVDSVFYGNNLPQGYSGQDVIIGITDWGLDFTHPVFYDSTFSNYRILRVWDQYRNAGPAPEGFDYGTEIIGQEQLLLAECDTSNIYGRHYHATHVGGIAAGSGAGTLYRGVAPDANIIFAAFRPTPQAVCDAFRWMARTAEELHKRLVINMSWGLFWVNYMDGIGPVAETIRELSEQGVVFVTSAGNDGNDQCHLSHTFTGPSDTVRTRWQFPATAANYWGTCLSLTSSPNKHFHAAINWANMSYSTIDESPFFYTGNGDQYIDTFLTNGTDTILYNVTILEGTETGRPTMQIRVKNASSPLRRYCLFITADEGTVHAWNIAELTTGVGNWGGSFSHGNHEDWISGDNYYTIGTPACVEEAISVGAHISANNLSGGGNMCSFSSYGPTIDGRTKPEISAPGNNVISAVSSFADDALTYVTSITYNDKRYGFSKLSGTSMSCPFTSGVVALMLQANPTLTPAQIKEIIMETATQDSVTTANADRCGAGKINAYRAVLRALYYTGIQQFNSNSTHYTVYPNPTTDQIFISSANNQSHITAQLYNIQGRLLQTMTIHQGVNTLNLTTYPTGCYILKIINNQHIQTEKIIKTR